MTIRFWFRKLFARTPRTVRRAPARFRPTLDALESRTVLSTLFVTNLGAGLLQAIRLDSIPAASKATSCS